MIQRLRKAEIENGNLINADDIAAELNQLVDANNALEERLEKQEAIIKQLEAFAFGPEIRYS